MTVARTRLFTRFALLISWIAVIPAQKQDDAADTARLIEVLQVREGSTVADIGAGSGELTVLMARHVGPAGKVFSTDVNPTRLKEIGDAVRKAGLDNVTIVEGGSARTNLPDQCCDAIFMRLVYHHFGDPAAMNASLRNSLKAGGRLAVVDFAPDSGVSVPAGRRDSGKNHGVMLQTVIDELRAAGLEDVRELSWPSPPGFLVVGRRGQ
jgi:ubiquinone/menaquinone biosynthesis C-methylase UbiE